MRRVVCVFAGLILFLPALGAQSFQRTQWYMTKQQVLSMEGIEPVRSTTDTVSFPKNLWNHRFTCTYGFTNNKLDAIYLEADEDSLFLEDILVFLRKDYGNPVQIQDPVQRILSWPVPQGHILVFADADNPRFSVFPNR